MRSALTDAAEMDFSLLFMDFSGDADLARPLNAAASTRLTGSGGNRSAFPRQAIRQSFFPHQYFQNLSEAGRADLGPGKPACVCSLSLSASWRARPSQDFTKR